MNKINRGRKSTKNNSKTSQNAMTTNFGERKIVGQNFSKMVSLPKTALENLEHSTTMKVELVQEKGEKFLKLSPSKGGKRS